MRSDPHLLVKRTAHPELIFLFAVALLVGGCTLFSGDENATDTTTTTTAPDPEDSPAETLPQTDPGPVPEPGPGELFELLGPEDRIVVQTAEQNLSILTFAGEVLAATTNDAAQPVFSPDGRRLAWTTFNPASTSGAIVFGSVAEDGSVTIDAEVPAPVVSYYSVWAPDGSGRLAILGNAPGGTGLAVVDEGGSTPVVEADIPYYFSWRPEADGVVAHAGNRLRSFDLLTGVGTDVQFVAPTFRAPALLADGSAVFVVANNVDPAGGDGAVLRLDAELDGAFNPDLARRIVDFNGRATLVLSPDGKKLSILVEGSGVVAQVNNTAGGGGHFQDRGTLGRGLHILNLETEEISTLRTEAIRAAFWAPNSEMIASVNFDSLGDGRAYSSWTVSSSDGEEISRTPRFVLSTQFEGAYLPFYDQYAQALTIWSPDSSRLVFPGSSVGRDEGIWLHRLPDGRSEAATFKIAEGSVAFWSPVRERRDDD
ncbi:MAG: hypothetical protein HKN03_03175 [Acidimicrobiales bacterium]|nr:hypothetical protein [Acidimicrobiales bacterium]